MDDERFNMSLRKYLKRVGVTSQQAIERQVREAGLEHGQLEVRMVLTIAGQDFAHAVDGVIELD
jgi:hypothetical protein